jgi:hypothetical protein
MEQLMGLTQQIGASSIIKPGVIDNTAARPASPYEGQVIFQKDTDQLLVWNGTAWVIPNSPAQNPTGLEYVAGASFSAVTEILIDSKFTSTYRNYRLVLDCQSSAGGSVFSWQLRSGSSTISTTTYQFQFLSVDSTTVSSSRTTGASSVRIGANDTSAYHALTSDIFCPQVAEPTRIINTFNRNSGNTTESIWGANTNSTSYDGMRISVGSGNMTGSYTLYGYRK